MDFVIAQGLATIGSWLWPFIKSGAENFVNGFSKELGEDFAKRFLSLLEKARKVNPSDTQMIDQSPSENRNISKKLFLETLQNNVSDSQNLITEFRPVLKMALRNQSFFAYDDLQVIINDLDYHPQMFGQKWFEQANNFVDKVIADGKLDTLLETIQKYKKWIFAKKDL